MVELRVLGHLEVVHGDQPVALPGIKRRQLLALLAMRPNRSVSSDQLIDELWDGDPPPSAPTALRMHVARLRQALEPERAANAPSSRLPASSRGYLLRVEPDELDADRFERLVLLAREAHADGDADLGVTFLIDALRLWRGAAYGEARDLSATRIDVARLEEMRSNAIEDLAEAHLARGEHTQAVELLSEAVDEFPLRERLTALLMRALYRCGRQADALRAYTVLGQRLDELGVEPSPELRRLEGDVLLRHRRLEDNRGDADRGIGRPAGAVVRFVGRREELGRLLALHRDLAGGGRSLALVSGTAGIGKTTLAAEYAQRLASQGGTLATGACDPNPSGSYQPIPDILNALVSTLDEETRARVPADVAGLLAGTTAPGSRPSDTAHADQFRLFEAVARTLDLVTDRPLVVVIEDIHWADRPTLSLLRHLLRGRSLDRLLLLATYRDDEISADRAETIEELAPPAAVTHLHLGGFTDNEARALVRAAAAPEVIHALVEDIGAVQEFTGGIPFLMRELLRELDSQAKFDEADDVRRALSSVAPAGVQALMERRAAELSKNGRVVLNAAATLGRDISAELLASACHLPIDGTLDAIEESLAARLLVEDSQHVGRYVFPHALVRNAIFTKLSPRRRRQVHLQVAEALAPPDGEPPRSSAELAYHYDEAVPVGPAEPAAAWAQTAGHEAAQRFAFAEAADWYERAIHHHEHTDQPVAFGTLLLALGRAYEGDHQFGKARDAYLGAAGRARAAGDNMLLADIAIAACGHWSTGFAFHSVAEELVDDALAALGNADPMRRVQLLNGLAGALYYVDAEREARCAREAFELAQHLDDAAALATAHISLHRSRTHDPEARAERLRLSEAAERLTVDAPADLHLRARRALLGDLLENARIDQFDASLDDYEQAATRLANPHGIYWAMVLRATQAGLRGDLTGAEQLARGAELRGRDLQQTATGVRVLQDFVVRYQQRRLAELVGDLRLVVQDHPTYRAGAALAATACAETGSVDEAERIAWKSLGPDGADLPRDAFWLGGLALFAAAASVGTDAGLQRLIADLMAPCADHLVIFGVGGTVLGSGHHWLGVLANARGDHELALDHLTRALAESERIGAPYWAAEARVETAVALSARGGRGAPGVDELLRGALAVAEAGDYHRVIERARTLR